jgi:hypothetical protein
MSMPLYAVTTVERGFGRDKQATHRTVGIFTTIDGAWQAVNDNDADIHETSYAYAVISEFPSDSLYGLPHGKETWYEWVLLDDEDGTWGYTLCDKPAQFAGIVGWCF